MTRGSRLSWGDVDSPRRTLLNAEYDNEANGDKSLEEHSPGSGIKVMWKCRAKGHTWQASLNNRGRKGQDCPACAKNRSQGEIFVTDFLRNTFPDLEVVNGNRSLIPPYEIDIYVPSARLAFEFNGDYWHSQQKIALKNFDSPEEYHKMKVDRAAEKGVALIHIAESDWENHQEAIQIAIKKMVEFCSPKESDSFINGSILDISNSPNISVSSLSIICNVKAPFDQNSRDLAQKTYNMLINECWNGSDFQGLMEYVSDLPLEDVIHLKWVTESKIENTTRFNDFLYEEMRIIEPSVVAWESVNPGKDVAGDRMREFVECQSIEAGEEDGMWHMSIPVWYEAFFKMVKSLDNPDVREVMARDVAEVVELEVMKHSVLGPAPTHEEEEEFFREWFEQHPQWPNTERAFRQRSRD